ncbi:MAG TPA: S9 family peptidase [Bacteroidales bacterium]|nr:S9 family peptidase [Bacteroidales bacterium]HPS17842.1 S9 family peptidase [Bacteroidales bacterium]
MKKIFFILSLFAITVIANAQNKLTPELLWKFGRINEMQLSPDGKTILYVVKYFNLAENNGNSDIYTITSNGGTPKKLTDTKESEFNAVWRPDGKKIAYISSASGSTQVWEMNPDGSNKKQITEIEDGINGFAYSPTLKNFLFIKDVKLDKTLNEIYPDLPKANAMLYSDLMYRHWDSWTDCSYSHVCFTSYDSTKKISSYTDIMKDEKYDCPLTPFGGMEQITWSPDGKQIAYTCKKLNGKEDALSTNSDIYIYNIETKLTTNISDGMPGYDQDAAFSPDGKKIVWSSMKTASYESDKKQIMLYDIATRQHTDLSEKFDEGSSNFRWDPVDNNIIYFISGKNATYQIFSINITTKQITQITKGTHDYTGIEVASYKPGKSKNLQTLITGTKMSMSLPTEIFKVEKVKNNFVETQITFTNKSILDTIKLGKVEERWITTTDKKKMLVWVIYPPNFDKTKKYPALLYCEGGPQSAVSQFWSYRWNFQMMAANDYIVVAPNRRGLPTFGTEWNDQIAQDYGGQNMKDYLTAIDTVSAESYVDKAHLGAVGASYGGYSVYWLAGNHNKRFKAFIAHCGMFDFKSWYGSTEEMWFANHDLGGAYWKNPQPKSYDFSPSNFVGKWDTPILVIEGGNDFRIPYTQGMEAFNAAQLQGIPSEFLFFPEESHFVLKPQNSVLWQRTFFAWLDKWLKTDK